MRAALRRLTLRATGKGTKMGNLALTYLLLITSAAAQDAQWETITEKDGIVVQQREVPGRSLPVFRGEMVIETNVYEILGILQDIERNPEWMHACLDAKRIKMVSHKEYIAYNRSDAPWPISDRDVVVHAKADINREKGELMISMRSIDMPDFEQNNDVVRMPRLNGHYRFKELEPRKTWIEYEIDADPGGSLPGWLVRIASRDIPLITLQNLRERVKVTEKEGTYASYIESIRHLN